jgi:hypothetical protein
MPPRSRIRITTAALRRTAGTRERAPGARRPGLADAARRRRAPRRSSRRVRHRQPMLSLDNAFSDEDDACAFLERLCDRLDIDAAPPLVAEPKLDGIAVSLIYSAGTLVKRAATRGDGSAARTSRRTCARCAMSPCDSRRVAGRTARGARRDLHAPRGLRGVQRPRAGLPVRKPSSTRAMPPPAPCGSSIHVSRPRGPCGSAATVPATTHSPGSGRNRTGRFLSAFAACLACRSASSRSASRPGRLSRLLRAPAGAARRSGFRHRRHRLQGGQPSVAGAPGLRPARRAGRSRASFRHRRRSPCCVMSSFRSGAPAR